MPKNRLKPYISRHEYSYVLYRDIEEFHGEEWYKKFTAQMRGSTCPCVDKADAEENEHEFVPVEGYPWMSAVYSWDYERFADAIDYNRPTYFD